MTGGGALRRERAGRVDRYCLCQALRNALSGVPPEAPHGRSRPLLDALIALAAGDIAWLRCAAQSAMRAYAPNLALGAWGQAPATNFTADDRVLRGWARLLDGAALASPDSHTFRVARERRDRLDREQS